MQTSLKIALSIAALAASWGASAAPVASTAHGVRHELREIDNRQANQERRIEQALARGQLDRREANQLQRTQRDIRQAEQRAKADGRVDRFELRQLTAMLDRADAQIRQHRHDRHDGRPV